MGTRADLPSSAGIRLLGGASCDRSESDAGERSLPRHALALVALLATAPHGRMTRDKLVAFLWPEGDPEAVRHRLNVVLHGLRKAVGRDAVITVGDALRLDPTQVRVDVAELLAAAARGDGPQVAALYGGPFLDGFHLPESIEFEDWSARERDRLQALVAGTFDRMGADAAARGEWEVAVRWYRRMVELDPLASRGVLGLVRALGRSGATAEALRVGRTHAVTLGRQLGVGADPQVEAILRKLRSTEPTPPPDDPEPQLAPTGIPRSVSGRTGGPTRRNRSLSARLAVVLGVIGLVAVSRWPLGGAGRAATDPVGSTRIVVLPFVVHGDERLAYLSEGIAELLGVALDGVGPLRTADPHAVLARARREPGDPSDPARAQRIAAGFGAAHVLLGSLVETGGRLDLAASLYDATGALLTRATARARNPEAIGTALDSLTRHLVASRYRADAERLAQVAILTSSSLPALSAYLQGEALRRAGDHGAAAGHYRTAIGHDSSFALAWYRLAVAAERSFLPHEAAAAVGAAVRHAARLPARDRLLLSGWEAYARGRAEEAERLYQRVVDLYPDEVEAWLQLGEIAFHFAASRGATIGSAAPAFGRVLELDPEHEAAHTHLARIAASLGNREALSEHAGALLPRLAETPVGLELRALLAFAARDEAEVRALEPELARQDSYSVLGLLLSLFFAGEWDGVDWCAGLLRGADRPVEVQVAGHLVAALRAVGAGRVADAFAGADAIGRFDPLRAAELRAWLASLPFVPSGILRGSLDPLRLAAALESEPGPASESFFLPDPTGLRRVMRPYLRGLLLVRGGDSLRALEVARELEGRSSAPSEGALATDLATGIRAEVARRAGRPQDARALLEQIAPRPSYQLVLPAPFEPLIRERYLLATLMLETGDAVPARRILASVGRRSLYDLAFDAPARLHLAEAWAEEDPDSALVHLAHARRHWARADSGLAVLREAVANRVAQIR